MADGNDDVPLIEAGGGAGRRGGAARRRSAADQLVHYGLLVCKIVFAVVVFSAAVQTLRAPTAASGKSTASSVTNGLIVSDGVGGTAVSVHSPKKDDSDEHEHDHDSEPKNCPPPAAAVCPPCPTSSSTSTTTSTSVAAPAVCVCAPCPTPDCSAVALKPADVRISPLLRHLLDVGQIDSVWSWFLARHPNPSQAVVVEVGSYNCLQAIEAGARGFQTIALEPSPKSFANCQAEIGRNGAAAKNIKLLQVAASNQTGKVTFQSAGSTGDHVGHNPGEVVPGYHDGSLATTVPAAPVDEILKEHTGAMAPGKGVYMIKIDTQGYDPFVLDGLRETLKAKKVMYLIIEFWPTAVKGAHNRNAGDMLLMLAQNGYSMYDSRMLWLRGFAPTPLEPKDDFMRPTIDSDAYAKFYTDRDARDKDTFGSWTDIIAVAEGVELTPFFFPK